MQVRYVFMGAEQSEAYEDAINRYRAASQARMMKSSMGMSNNVVGLLPKRQISNYFVQFRKVPMIFFCIYAFYAFVLVVILHLCWNIMSDC